MSSFGGPDMPNEDELEGALLRAARDDLDADADYHAWQRANEAPTVYSEVPMIPGEHEEATITSGNSDQPEEVPEIEVLRAQVAGFDQTWQGQEAEIQRLRVENLTLRIRLDMINELYQAEQEKRRG